MKRFIAMCALALAPFGLKADAQSMDKNCASSSCNMVCNATAAADETWADRTQVGAAFGDASRPWWDVQTIQPIYRTDSTMCNTFFAQGDFGFRKWDSPGLSLGLGYRHLSGCGNFMYGANMFYDHSWSHSMNNLGVGLEWFGRFFTMRLNYNTTVHHDHHNIHTLTHFFHGRRNGTDLSFNFQLPYLPWTVASVGPIWHHTKGHHDNHHKRFSWKYALRFNIAGPVALETGFGEGWGKGGYVKLAVNFGRAAVVEHALTDADPVAATAFTARDLKNYTLEPVGRFGWIR